MKTDFFGKRVHFVGIGGISMSGLAEILLQRGAIVSGSDMRDSDTLDKLRSEGIKVFVGHDRQNSQHADLIVYTAAIAADNPELDCPAEKMSRAVLLGKIMSEYGTAIGVSGAHGKTTASSMIATILMECGKNPTIHIGGILPAVGGATRVGGEEFFVAEACEYTNSFLSLHPNVEVLLNIDEDHLDFFKDIDDIFNSFSRYTKLLPPDGTLVGNGDDSLVARLLEEYPGRTVTFGLEEGNYFTARQIERTPQGQYCFKLMEAGQEICDVKLTVPGKHTVYNALAAIACCSVCGVSAADSAAALSHYVSSLRRFQYMGEYHGARVYHDYAHHPAEIAATLSALRGMTGGRVICAFEPHTYSRTKALFDRFTQCFSDADAVIVLPIYAAREKDPGDISAAMLFTALLGKGKECYYAADFEEAAEIFRRLSKPDDILVTLGAGSVEKLKINED